MGSLPKVLVISHTVFSCTENMGKTMMDMFSCVPPENLAQLYFRSGAPTQHGCQRYFRISDKDILYSVFTGKRRFRIFRKEEIGVNTAASQLDTGISAHVYQFSRKRTPAVYFLRNLLWTLGKWDTPELDAWISEFSPDMIFFAASDYAFAYKIVWRLAERYDLPVILWCADDHYISRKKTWSPLYHYVCRNRMKWVRKTMKRCTHMITISDKMNRDYSALFKIPATTMRISAVENSSQCPAQERSGIVYAGNLGVNRIIPLVEAGKALKAAGIPGYEQIDVYSADKNPKTLKQLTQANGIRFHGAVGREQLEKILGSAKFVLHTEAFDEKSKTRTRYSLSTKVGEYLGSGACIVAFGPQDISSVEYLSGNCAGLTVQNADGVSREVSRILNDPEAFDRLQRQARDLLRRGHCKLDNDEALCAILKKTKEMWENNQ